MNRSTQSNAARHFLLSSLLVALTPLGAQAYATGSSATKDCHEQITWFALDNSSFPNGATPPPSEAAERIANQLPVEVPKRHRNLWGVSTVIGTRYPDFEGAEPSDFVALNVVHSDNDDQREHCLRMAEHDDVPGGDPAGSRAAVADCRAFIMEQVELALGSGADVDVNEIEEVEMWLAFVGDDEVDLQRFGFYMGQALHALQDSFSHSVRTEDGRQVLHVLNYIETLGDGVDEDVDGHEHSSPLDDCEIGVEIVDRRVRQAMEASAALLNAVADGSGGRAGRVANARAVLDDWLTFAEGNPCVNDIDTCNPPELAVEAPGCSAGGRAGGGALALILGLLGLVAFRRRAIGVAATLVFCGLLAGSVASAQATGAPGAAGEADPERESAPPDAENMRAAESEGNVDVAMSDDEAVTDRAAEVEAEGGVVVDVDHEEEELAVVERRQVEASDGGAPVNNGVGFQVSLFGSMDEAGFGAALGLRIPINHHFILGVDAEYDSWYSVEAGKLETGALNAYLTGIIVWKTLDKVEIRTNVHAGVTVLLSELYNTNRFNVGPFFAITPVAMAIRVTRAIRVTIDPGGIFVEIPRLDPGPPLLRRAHRLMVGMHVTL